MMVAVAFDKASAVMSMMTIFARTGTYCVVWNKNFWLKSSDMSKSIEICYQYLSVSTKFCLIFLHSCSMLVQKIRLIHFDEFKVWTLIVFIAQ